MESCQIARQTRKVTRRRVKVREVGVCSKCRRFMSTGKKKKK